MRHRLGAAGLIPLAALWGSSFLFIGMAVPALGSLGTAEARAALGGLVAAGLVWLRARRIRFGQGLWRYTLLGLYASAAPYVLMSYATAQQGASLTAIFFATVPLFGVLIELVWLHVRPAGRVVGGVVVGLVGVALVVGNAAPGGGPRAMAAYAAALGAAFCSAMGGHYSTRHFAAENAMTQTVGQSLTAAVLLLPFVLISPPHAWLSFRQWGAVLALGVLCTAVAYTLFFWLVARLGATRALTVELLVPGFATLWGWLFLHEYVTVATLLGALAIVAGCALVTRRPSPDPAALA